MNEGTGCFCHYSEDNESGCRAPALGPRLTGMTATISIDSGHGDKGVFEVDGRLEGIRLMVDSGCVHEALVEGERTLSESALE